MTSVPWKLHPTLAADCHVLGRVPSAWLLLHRNAALHWFILVPECAALDLFDLPAPARDALLSDGARISEVLKSPLGYPRVNVGALGLVVPQLHLHLVGRRESDPCWPAPVWGNLASGSHYSEGDLAKLCQQLQGALQPAGFAPAAFAPP